MRTLLIGCGKHGGTTLLPAALSVGIQISGLVDRDIGVAETVGKRWNIAAVHASADEAETAGVDAAIIALPINEQARHVSWALSRGLHVFVEKPPAADVTQLRAVLDQVRASGRVCRVGMNFRFADGVRALLARTTSGRHGTVSYVRVAQIAHKPVVSFDPDLSMEASLFHAQGIHAMDLAMQLVPTAHATSGQLLRVDRGRLCAVVGEDEASGARFEVSFGSCGAGLYHQVDVFSDTGDLFSLRDLTELHYLPHGGAPDVGDYPGARVAWRRSPVTVGYAAAGYAAELAAFRAAASGEPSAPGPGPAALVDLLPVYEAFDRMLAMRGLKWTA